jgi:hypothetical protein
MWITRKVRVISFIVAIVTLGTLAFVSTRSEDWRSWLSVQGKSERQKIEPVIIVLTPTGFEPNEITRPKGLFLLVVNNRSNNPDITLRLDHESGRRTHEEHLHGGKIDWRQPVDLPPGRYVLTEPNHPEWTCSFMITGN